MKFRSRMGLIVLFALCENGMRDLRADPGHEPIPTRKSARAFESDGEEKTLSEKLWKSHVEPLFRKRCQRCHGEKKTSGGLDLRTIQSTLEGGLTGPAIVPGDLDRSPLYQFVQPGRNPSMPPGDEQLTKEEIALLKHWIRGAESVPDSESEESEAGE